MSDVSSEPVQSYGSSYYNEGYALQAKAIADKMMELNKNIILPWSKLKGFGNKSTVVAKVTRGFKYLVDHLDTPDSKYKRFRNSIIISCRPTGLFLQMKGTSCANVSGEQTIANAMEVVEEKDNSLAWKSKVEEFIELSQKEDKLIIEKIILTEEAMQLAASYFDNANAILDPTKPTFAFKIDINSIKAIRRV